MPKSFRFPFAASLQKLQALAPHWHPVAARLQQNPLARLHTAEEVAIAAKLGICIDANQATVDDWLRLPDLSIHQARTLAALTQRGVPLHCLEDVAAVLGLSRDRVAIWAPVLQFCYYDDASAVAPIPRSINAATRSELLTLPDMSPALAERIVNERRRQPFRDWGDVQERLRLPSAQTAQWIYYLNL